MILSLQCGLMKISLCQFVTKVSESESGTNLNPDYS